MSTKQWQEFAPLRTSQLRVARAWAIKEMAMRLWGYVRRGWAEQMWKRWYSWAIRTRLGPHQARSAYDQASLGGCLNAVTSNVTNARSESVNSKPQ